MNWKRSTWGLLLGGSLCVFNVGCAAMNALVSSPAGQSAGHGSSDRIAAIGRVFENQGKYAQAQDMYRRALSSNPSNSVAKERMQHIASMNSKRTFDTPVVKPQASSILAVADSLNAQRKQKPRRLGSTPLTEAPKPVEIAKELLQETPESIVASLTPVPPKPSEETMTIEPAITAYIAEELDVAVPETPVPEVPTVEVTTPEVAVAKVSELIESDAGDIELTNPGWALDQSVSDSVMAAADVALTFAPGKTEATISTVGFEGDDKMVASVASNTSWKSSNRVVTLEELLEWSDSPEENTDNLLYALTSGEDDTVKAFAATLLVDCPADHTEINASLRHACGDGSPLLRVSCRDSLIQRGEVDEDSVNDLLELLSESDADIQAQSAASLRNLAGTEWSAPSVAGLQGMLTDNDQSLVAVAAATLGDFGPDATSCRGQLMELVSSTSPTVRAAADLALNRIPIPDVSLQPVDMSNGGMLESTISVDGYLPIVE